MTVLRIAFLPLQVASECFFQAPGVLIVDFWLCWSASPFCGASYVSCFLGIRIPVYVHLATQLFRG